MRILCVYIPCVSTLSLSHTHTHIVSLPLHRISLHDSLQRQCETESDGRTEAGARRGDSGNRNLVLEDPPTVMVVGIRIDVRLIGENSGGRKMGPADPR